MKLVKQLQQKMVVMSIYMYTYDCITYVAVYRIVGNSLFIQNFILKSSLVVMKTGLVGECVTHLTKLVCPKRMEKKLNTHVHMYIHEIHQLMQEYKIYQF